MSTVSFAAASSRGYNWLEVINVTSDSITLAYGADNYSSRIEFAWISVNGNSYDVHPWMGCGEEDCGKCWVSEFVGEITIDDLSPRTYYEIEMVHTGHCGTHYTTSIGICTPAEFDGCGSPDCGKCYFACGLPDCIRCNG